MGSEALQLPAHASHAVLPSRPGNHRGLAILLAATLVCLFALLQNPYWVRGGDSEVYLCLARSIVQGKGLRFNGQPVGLVPPGWPLLLSAMMRLTHSFLGLKLMLMLLVAAGLTIYFMVLQQLANWRIALASVLVCALLPSIYRLTYQFLAEPMFCVACGAALWLAQRIHRGPGRWWDVAILALLCVIAMSARWTMLIFWPIVAGLLLRDELWPRRNVRWMAAWVSGAVTLTCFVLMRHYLKVDPHQLDARFDSTLSTEYALVTGTAPNDTLLSRVADTQSWLANVLWVSTGTSRTAQWLSSTGAALLLLVYTIFAAVRAQHREWVWLAALLYYLALALNWPSPVARYVVPIAPLLIAGVLLGLIDGAHRLTRRSEIVSTVVCGVVIGLIAVPNALLFAGNVVEMRATEFHQVFQNGTDQSLTQAARLMREAGIRNGDLVVSRYYDTRGGAIHSNTWMRALHLLTNRSIRSLPDDLGPEPDENVLRWMAVNRAEYYMYQPAVAANDRYHWDFWRDLTAKHLNSEWRLYRLKHGVIDRLRLKDDHVNGPRAMPGL